MAVEMLTLVKLGVGSLFIDGYDARSFQQVFKCCALTVITGALGMAEYVRTMALSHMIYQLPLENLGAGRLSRPLRYMEENASVVNLTHYFLI
jgi:hypothetical protein